ncbi:MAG: hypothetical protein ABII23_05370 [bacterium]
MRSAVRKPSGIPADRLTRTARESRENSKEEEKKTDGQQDSAAL